MSILRNKYVVYTCIQGTQGYVGKDIEKGEDNLYRFSSYAKVFNTRNEAQKVANYIEIKLNGYDATVLTYRQAKKYDKKQET